MPNLRATLVQANMTVGALNANAGKILRLAHEAAEAGAGLIAFPELALSGYPPEDLVLKRHFLEDTEREIERLAAELPPEPLVIVGAPAALGPRACNAAYAFQGGAVRAIYRKMLLPNYGVFDEQRVFAAGTEPVILPLANGLRLGLHICEDSWDPAAAACTALAGRVDLVLNISGSPYHRGKGALREQTLRAASRAIGAPLLYCNLVGGQDELVFDGASLFLDADGVRARAKQFDEDMLHVDLPESSNVCKNSSERLSTSVNSPPRHPKPDTSSLLPPPLPDLAEVYAALVLGLRDYTNKNGFSGVVLGLSGGIDSALVAALAVDALGADRVHGITLPSRYSSAGTRGDAHQLAANLGIPIMETPIQGLYDAFVKDLSPLWPGRAPDTTEENLQARIRGVIVMALSNKFGWLVLTTGNKSELATGYCTLYGDMAGGFAVIKDVPKTLVFELAKWRNAQAIHPVDAVADRVPPRPTVAATGGGVIPESIITRPPSAELKENQTDQDTLPPYDVLDGIIERYVERDWGLEAIIADGYDAATVKRVIRLIDVNEYKRRQGAPGVKITPKAFGRDRRLPITNLYRERTG
jgi:NAD+ synthase (glutamine-hydrolysing)